MRLGTSVSQNSRSTDDPEEITSICLVLQNLLLLYLSLCKWVQGTTTFTPYNETLDESSDDEGLRHRDTTKEGSRYKSSIHVIQCKIIRPIRFW